MSSSGCFCCHVLIIIRSPPRNVLSLCETCHLSPIDLASFLVKQIKQRCCKTAK